MFMACQQHVVTCKLSCWILKYVIFNDWLFLSESHINCMSSCALVITGVAFVNVFMVHLVIQMLQDEYYWFLQKVCLSIVRNRTWSYYQFHFKSSCYFSYTKGLAYKYIIIHHLAPSCCDHFKPVLWLVRI